MKTSELTVLTDSEMESVQGGLIAERQRPRRPLLALLLLVLRAILRPYCSYARTRGLSVPSEFTGRQ